MRYFVFRKKDNNSKKQKGGNSLITKEKIDIKDGAQIDNKKQIDTPFRLKSKKLIKREFPNANEYSFFTCVHNVLQNNKIIPNEYPIMDFYKDIDIDICPDKNVSQSTTDALKKNLIIKHDYSEDTSSEVAYNGVNIIIINDNKFEALNKIDKSLPTILLYHDGNKYYVIYEKDNGLFNTNSKFIKGIISSEK